MKTFSVYIEFHQIVSNNPFFLKRKHRRKRIKDNVRQKKKTYKLYSQLTTKTKQKKTYITSRREHSVHLKPIA